MSFLSCLKSCLLILSLGLLSCKGDMETRLEDADHLAIAFVDPEAGNRVVETDEKNAMKRLSQFMDGKAVQKADGCQPDGFVLFSRAGKELEKADFYFREGCRYFVFEHDNKTEVREMSNEAADFLLALKQGRSFY